MTSAKSYATAAREALDEAREQHGVERSDLIAEASVFASLAVYEEISDLRSDLSIHEGHLSLIAVNGL